MYKTMNWREAVRTNQNKTYAVIATFVLLLLSVGFLADFTWDYMRYTNVAPLTIIKALIIFKLTPYVTIISLAVAVIWIGITFLYHDKLMLLGTDYIEVNELSQDPLHRKIYNVVEEMKIAANMRFMPKVFLLNASYMNAFASGYSEESAMIAVTEPLVEALNRDELQAVVAHELTHIRNQDIKLNLFTVILSSMLLIMIDMLFNFMWFFGGSGRSRDNERSSNNNVMTIIFVLVMILRFVLPLLTMVLMLFLSRTREYMADAGAVELMRNNQPLADALIKINQASQNPQVEAAYSKTPHENLRYASYIYDPKQAGFKNGGNDEQDDFFSTHPSLSNRLKSIGAQKP